MLDLKYIRDNRHEVGAGLQGRLAMAPTAIKILLMADARHRDAQQKVQEAQAALNVASKEIGTLIHAGKHGEAENKRDEVASIKRGLARLDEAEKWEREIVSKTLLNLPNIPTKNVPIGPDERFNIELFKSAMPKPRFEFTPKEHFDLGAPLGMDFETAATVAGSRFAFLKGKMARLERAIGQYMLDFYTSDGLYEEVAPPLLVNEAAMRGTGQLPKFEEDLFKTTDGRYLIPTAEVPLTNMVAQKVSEEATYRYAALTPCFRAEAGSAGRDTRGLIRQHQFNKVELVAITPDPGEDWQAEQDRMIALVGLMLTGLGLPFRAVLLCSGDTGFSARRTVDLEVWLPGQNAYREISSISYFGDFQARRMEARYRPSDEQKGTKHFHTYNGSGVAVGRALVAILENYQNEDGSIRVPEALAPYMSGIKVISP